MIYLLPPPIPQSSLTAQLEYKLPSLLATGRVKLVVIDSIAALFRAEFGVQQAVQRAQLLQACGSRLQQLSVTYGAAVVCINQVYTMKQCTSTVASLGGIHMCSALRHLQICLTKCLAIVCSIFVTE